MARDADAPGGRDCKPRAVVEPMADARPLRRLERRAAGRRAYGVPVRRRFRAWADRQADAPDDHGFRQLLRRRRAGRCRHARTRLRPGGAPGGRGARAQPRHRPSGVQLPAGVPDGLRAAGPPALSARLRRLRGRDVRPSVDRAAARAGPARLGSGDVARLVAAAGVSGAAGKCGTRAERLPDGRAVRLGNAVAAGTAAAGRRDPGRALLQAAFRAAAAGGAGGGPTLARPCGGGGFGRRLRRAVACGVWHRTVARLCRGAAGDAGRLPGRHRAVLRHGQPAGGVADARAVGGGGDGGAGLRGPGGGGRRRLGLAKAGRAVAGRGNVASRHAADRAAAAVLRPRAGGGGDRLPGAPRAGCGLAGLRKAGAGTCRPAVTVRTCRRRVAVHPARPAACLPAAGAVPAACAAARRGHAGTSAAIASNLSPVSRSAAAHRRCAIAASVAAAGSLAGAG